MSESNWTNATRRTFPLLRIGRAFCATCQTVKAFVAAEDAEIRCDQCGGIVRDGLEDDLRK